MRLEGSERPELLIGPSLINVRELERAKEGSGFALALSGEGALWLSGLELGIPSWVWEVSPVLAETLSLKCRERSWVSVLSEK